MSEAPFKVGDLVRLRNPWGPEMTVDGVGLTADGRQSVDTIWFDAGSRLLHATFSSDVLDLVPPA